MIEPLRFGTKVKLFDTWTKVQTEGVVCEIAYNAGSWEYGVSGSWWYSHNDLEVIGEPTSESIMEAVKYLEPEDLLE